MALRLEDGVRPSNRFWSVVNAFRKIQATFQTRIRLGRRSLNIALFLTAYRTNLWLNCVLLTFTGYHLCSEILFVSSICLPTVPFSVFSLYPTVGPSDSQ